MRSRHGSSRRRVPHEVGTAHMAGWPAVDPGRETLARRQHHTWIHRQHTDGMIANDFLCESAMTDEPRYWFPAKRYGWGWGPPTAWQGWVVLIGFFALVLAGAVLVLPQRGPVAFVAYTLVLSGLLVVICWIKGERPRWRWGGKDL